MEITGFNEFRRKLDSLARAAEKLDGMHSVRFDELFHQLFMIENTGFGSIDEFGESCPVDMEKLDDLDSDAEATLNEFVRQKTRFQSWDEMKETAGKEWMMARFNAELD